MEGYLGHGVFTWALIDALHNGDKNGDGLIELSELVAHVQDAVPKISAQLNGRGIVHTATQAITQTARRGDRRRFAIARRLQ